MDTSTLSHTDDFSPLIDLPQTSLLTREQARPIAAEWFTRLISLSPLTSSSTSPNSPDSTMLSTNTYREIQDQYPVNPQYPQHPTSVPGRHSGNAGPSTVLLIFIPIMVVILTVLLGLVFFLVAVLFMRRRKGIKLTEDGGPLDLSKGDGIMGEGGFEGVESRWLDITMPAIKQGYLRAKEWQSNYPPASVPADITLSQFLSIQEKGVSAWSFEPDYEDNLSLYVQSRTEITFLSDGPGMAPREGGGNSVMANLPLPKLNEVYYFEVKMYDKPANTEVSIGLATRPYPSFRLPGLCRHSVAYFASDGFKSHDYPFTASSYGAPLNEGDVLGVGYRPRTGTVFFTRNGRKMEDAYTGLQRLNLFPIVGANGPCTIHVNLGQSGFVFIEAQVKKWGLAPMTGTLAPPPAYGSERGSILLDAGYGTPGSVNRHDTSGIGALLEAARARQGQLATSFTSSHGRPIPHTPGASPRSSNSSRRHRRAGRAANLAGSVPAVPSPLRTSEAGPGPSTAGSRRRALGRAHDDTQYISPTDVPVVGPRIPAESNLDYDESDEDGESVYESISSREIGTSPIEHNPPTPNLLDISLHSLRPGYSFGGRNVREGANERQGRSGGGGDGSGSGSGSGESDQTVVPGGDGLGPPQGDSPPPPNYVPIDPVRYSAGLPADLPENLVLQAIEAMSGGPMVPTQPEQQATPTPAPRGIMSWLRGA